MVIQKRGQLTYRIQEKSKELLGHTITLEELRLTPYIQYTLVNDQHISNSSINSNDVTILKAWVKRKYIVDGVTEKGRPMINNKLRVTKKFWNFLNEILWLGYVDLTR